MQMQIGIPNVDINGSKNRRRNLWYSWRGSRRSKERPWFHIYIAIEGAEQLVGKKTRHLVGCRCQPATHLLPAQVRLNVQLLGKGIGEG